VDERHVRVEPAAHDGVGTVAMRDEPLYVATKAECAQPISTFPASSASNWKQGTFISLRRTDDGQVEAVGIYERDKAGTVRPSRSLAIAKQLAAFDAVRPTLDFVLLGRARASAREQKKSSTNGARRASAAQRDGPLPRAGDDEPPPADDVDPPHRLAVREAA